jgi:amidase
MKSKTRLDAINVQGLNRRRFLEVSGAIFTGGATWGIMNPTDVEAKVIAPAPHYSTAVDVMKKIQHGDLKVTDHIAAKIERAKAIQSQFYAIDYLAEKEAMQEAELLDNRIQRGDVDFNEQPLCGVVIDVKPNLAVKDLPTSFGANRYRNWRPTESTLDVRRARDKGAIVLTRSIMAFAGAGYVSEDERGKTANPYGLDRTVGGSSGGAAALVALGVVDWSLATDLGGSIRLPAGWCGVAGLRPSAGRIACKLIFHPSKPPSPPTKETPFHHGTTGPIARSVADLRMVYDAIAGPSASDPRSQNLPEPPPPKPVGDMRIAFWLGDDGVTPHPEIAANLKATAKYLRDLGARVVETPAPYDLREYGEIRSAHVFPGWLETIPKIQQSLGAQGHTWIDATRVELKKWVDYNSKEIETLKKKSPEVRAKVQASVEGFDAVLCPVAMTPALPIETQIADDLGIYAPLGLLSTVASLPSGSIRSGTFSSGLPLSVMVYGPPRNETNVFTVMEAIEQSELGGFRPPPPLL